MTHSGCAHEVALESSTVEALDACSEEAASEKQPESDRLQAYEDAGDVTFVMLEVLRDVALEPPDTASELLRAISLALEDDWAFSFGSVFALLFRRELGFGGRGRRGTARGWTTEGELGAW